MALVMLVAGCADGNVGGDLEVEGRINGESIADSRPNDAIELNSDGEAVLELSLTNRSNEPVTVGYVRFEGELLDMEFLSYDTAISVPLEPGESRELPPILFDFFDLGGQAHGLMRGHLQLYDADREPLGSEPVFLDATAPGFSNMELFNWLLLAGTAAGAAWTMIRLFQRRLPANRFVRGLRTMAIGAGAGLTLAAAFSTLRLWPLPTITWILFTVVGAVVGYVIGLLLPGSDDELIDILDEQDVLDAVLDEQLDLEAASAGRTTVVRGGS